MELTNSGDIEGKDTVEGEGYSRGGGNRRWF